MKVIFLDIDGVLNAIGLAYAGEAHALDRAAIDRVNRLAAATGAVVVLTSTWRLFHRWPSCRDILRAHGLTAEVVDETRDLWEEGEDAVCARRREIEDWAARHGARSYVVLDDLPLYPEGDPRFVQIDEWVGLTDADLERARAALR